MLLIKLAYFSISTVLFLAASFPYRNEMRNEQSFFSNLKKILKTKTSGSILLGLASLNMLLASSLFFLFSNTN